MPIWSMYERALSLSACKYIDFVDLLTEDLPNTDSMPMSLSDRLEKRIEKVDIIFKPRFVQSRTIKTFSPSLQEALDLFYKVFPFPNMYT